MIKYFQVIKTNKYTTQIKFNIRKQILQKALINLIAKYTLEIIIKRSQK